MFVVVGGTLHPKAAMPIGLNDLCAHVLIYYVLAMVFIIARPRSAGRSVLLLVGLGATTEVAQLFVPLRQADGMDLVANIFGIGAAYASWRFGGFVFRRFSRSPQHPLDPAPLSQMDRT